MKQRKPEWLMDYGWMPTFWWYLDEPNCGHRVSPHPNLDQLDADLDHTGGSSYYLSRRRKLVRKP